MNPNITESKPLISASTAVSRLTALWALHEAGLGGFIHLFSTPLGGVVMAGFATILITLIAYFADRNQSIIFKSLVLVVIAKIIASPHSGFLAYLAVTIQGLLGVILFKYIKSLRIASITLGVLALTESAIQKILLMVLIFGKPLWLSIDVFIAQLGVSMGYSFQNGSMMILGLYITIYILAGLLFGNFAYSLIKYLKTAIQEEYKDAKIDDSFIAVQQIFIERKKGNKVQKDSLWETLIIVGIVAIVLIFLSPSNNGWLTVFYTLLRCIAFVVLWFFIINPFLVKIFKQYFSKKQTKYQREVEDIFEFMSTLRKLVLIAWRETSSLIGIKRVKAFIKKTIAYTLLYEDSQKF